MMDRRTFLAGTGAVLLAAPVAAEAQQAGRVFRIGLLSGSQLAIDTLKEGPADLGHREGQSFVIDQRDVAGRFDLLPAAVDALVKLPVDVFVVGGSEFVQPVRNATKKIPIVFTNVSEPVEQGFIASYAKPGGNITGVTNMGSDLVGKWLELLKTLQPAIRLVAVLWNPPQPGHRRLLKALGGRLTRASGSSGGGAYERRSADSVRRHPPRARRRIDDAGLARAFQGLAPDRRLRATDQDPGRRVDECFHAGGRIDLLRSGRGASMAARRRVRGSHHEGRKARRPPRRAAHQVRAGHQPQDCQGARPDDPAVAAGAGG